VKRTALTLFALCAFSSNPATAKEFRHYFAMQWVVVPTSDVPEVIELAEGGTVAEAQMLTEDLFETTHPVSFGGKPIFGKGTQFATAVSAKSIRCTVGQGDKGTLSYKKRICLTDENNDGNYDHYFDVAPGMAGADIKFVGCMPPVKKAIDSVIMNAVDPVISRDPLKFRLKLNKIYGKKYRSKENQLLTIEQPSFEFVAWFGRNEEGLIHPYACEGSQYNCIVPAGKILSFDKDGIAFQVIRQNGSKAVIHIITSLSKRNYWDMSRGNRPPAQCPGNFFFNTDEKTF
jgi:hypothetical protein